MYWARCFFSSEDLDAGPARVRINGQQFEVIIAKIAINVVNRAG
jgi:hypothetical protein